MSDSDEFYEEELGALVIDTGSETIKAGFSGDETPRAVFPSVVGRRIDPVDINSARGFMPGHGLGGLYIPPPKNTYVGEAAQSRRGLCRLKYPIERGIITNWDDMEEILHHSFYNELRACPEEHSVLLTETAWNPKENREKTTQIMFERFNVAGFYLANQSVLALYASGRTTGVVIDSGSITRTVPVYEGHALKQAVNTLNIGGRDITDYWIKLLAQKGYKLYSWGTPDEREIRAYKEKRIQIYIAENYNNELKRNWSSMNCYELPDGQLIAKGDELFKCSEIIFNPKLYIDKGIKDNDGLSTMLIKTVISCDIDLRKDMMKNIILCGGNTMIDGIDKRLKMDIASICSKPLVNGFVRKYSMNRMYYDYLSIMYDYYGINDICHKYSSYINNIVGFNELNIVASENRKYNVWIGGSMLAEQSIFQDSWITKDEYDERGPNIVQLRCM